MIPFSEWQQMVGRLEELEDIADARQVSAAIAAGEETFPHEFSKRLVSGESHSRFAENIVVLRLK